MLTIAVIAIMIIALFAACIKGAYYSPEDREDDEVWCRLHVDENGKLHEEPPIDEIGYDIPDYTDDRYWGI
jgi:hypothetical protein